MTYKKFALIQPYLHEGSSRKEPTQMDRPIIPTKIKAHIVNAYAILALTGALFIGVFFVFDRFGVFGFIGFVLISAIILRWSSDVEQAERNYRRRKRTRQAL